MFNTFYFKTNNMKNLSTLIVAVLCFFLIGCSSGSGDTTAPTEENQAIEKLDNATNAIESAADSLDAELERKSKTIDNLLNDL